MNFLELAQKRHSVRAYKPLPIEQDKLDYVLECARLAPSAVNRQPWRLIVASNENAKESVRSAYDREWFKTAPCYVVVCVDTAEAWTRGADGKNHADIDGAIIAEHICLAAADAGLGSCWVCNFDPETLKARLNLGANLEPMAIIPIGYADESADVKPRERKPLVDIVRVE